ncbi:hypothetical protein MMC13_004063 [Lambiella insularis]|nr:hypothetical protein [Lambiella insularis]
MDDFCLDPQELPTTLYRVQYSGCITNYGDRSGLTAWDSQTTYIHNGDDKVFDGFGGAVEDHIWWNRCRYSFLISLFGSKRRAENWALNWSVKHPRGFCTVYEIEAAELWGRYIFRASQLCNELDLQVPREAKVSIRDEYLVAHNIPWQAISGWREVEDIKKGKQWFLTSEVWEA